MPGSDEDESELSIFNNNQGKSAHKVIGKMIEMTNEDLNALEEAFEMGNKTP